MNWIIRTLLIIAAFIFGWTIADMARAEAAGLTIVIDVSDQVMYVDTEFESYTWDVSTARKGYHTPRGAFVPYMLKPIHYSKKYDNAPMPNSIFFVGGYAIHATYDLKNLGRPASHGCIRLNPRNAEWLYYLVEENGKENTLIFIQD